MDLEHALDEIRNPVLGKAGSCIETDLETPIEPELRVGNLDDERRGRAGLSLARW